MKHSRLMDCFSYLLCSQAARPALDAMKEQELKESFDLFDADKTGTIDFYELKVKHVPAFVARGSRAGDLKSLFFPSLLRPSRF